MPYYKEYYEKNKAKFAADKLRWRAENPHRHAWITQRGNAKRRGIEFHFTYDEWVEWWGDDFDKRGRKADSLVMARHGDTGPYHPDNVKKITYGENTKEHLNGA